jgi:hypothetical protein
MGIHHQHLRRRCAAVLAATLLTPGPAPAHSLAYAVGTDNWSFTGPGQVIVPNTTTTAFSKPANQRLIISFAAECSVDAPAGYNFAWLDIDIVLLNAAGAVVFTAPPTVGSGDAFCSADGVAGFGGYSGSAVLASVPFNFPAGTYRAQVRARLNAGATGGWLGQREIVVSL